MALNTGGNTTVSPPTAIVHVHAPKPPAGQKPPAPAPKQTGYPTINFGHLPAALAPAGPGSVTPNQFAAAQTAKAQSSLDQYMNYLRTNMGRVDSTAINAQASAELNAETSPLLAGLASQQQAGAQAISGYTQQLAGNLAQIGPQTQQGYQTAEGQQAALDASIADRLGNNTANGVSTLQQQLAAAGQDTSPAAQAAQNAAGASGAAYASGSASLAQLYGQGAAANAYSAQLPGIAALAGYQQVGALNESIAAQRAQIIADAQKQYPGLVNDLTSQALTSQKNTADSLWNVAQAQQTNAQDATSNMLKVAGLDQASQIANAKLTQAGQIADAKLTQGGRKLTQSEQIAANKSAQTWTQRNGYLSDSSGNAILGKNGKPQWTEAAQNDQTRAAQQWTAKNGFISDANGNPVLGKDGKPVLTQAAVRDQASSSAAYTRANGFLSNPDGSPVLNSAGKLQPAGGYVLNKTGTGVVKLADKIRIRSVVDAEKALNFAQGLSGSTTARGWTSTNHYLSDKDGQPVLDASGHLQPQAGYKLNKDGSGVIPIPKQVKPPTPHSVTFNGSLYSFDPKSQKLTLLKQGPAPPAKTPSPKTFKLGNTEYVIDPKTLTAKPIATSNVKVRASGSLTENEVGHLLTTWHDGHVTNVRTQAVGADGKPVVNSDGSPKMTSQSTLSGKLTYPQAVAKLVSLGKTPAEAQAAANGTWEPGENGRPWYTPQVKSILAKGGTHLTKSGQVVGQGRGASVATLNGHQVLDPGQYAALKAANLLPYGQLTSQGFYVVGVKAG